METFEETNFNSYLIYISGRRLPATCMTNFEKEKKSKTVDAPLSEGFITTSTNTLHQELVLGEDIGKAVCLTCIGFMHICARI